MSAIEAVTSIQARITQIRSMVAPVTTQDAVTASTGSASLAGTATASRDFTSLLTEALATVDGTSTGASSGATGTDLVTAASKYLGTTYVLGGESLDEGGLDCSGLVQLALADLGVTRIPRTAAEQATIGEEIPSLAEARPGDLLIFDGGSHVGIYAGSGRMIDASYSKGEVVYRDVYATPTTIRRVVG